MWALKPCPLEINNNGAFKQEYVDLALQPLKLLYLHYHNAYSHETWENGD